MTLFNLVLNSHINSICYTIVYAKFSLRINKLRLLLICYLLKSNNIIIKPSELVKYGFQKRYTYRYLKELEQLNYLISILDKHSNNSYIFSNKGLDVIKIYFDNYYSFRRKYYKRFKLSIASSLKSSSCIELY